MQADPSGVVVTNSSNPMNHIDFELSGIQVNSQIFKST